jgi:16S rRNA A1518/A1519 N6-dimethyltransferase RsmA/KsgA/DIM1 with predicted DNA glycosylase/AP lyase activity
MPSETLQIIKDLGLLDDRRRAKRFGQHFLTDPRILSSIVDAAEPISGSIVVEIGPGPGGLTREILKRGPERVVVIEKDERFVGMLESLGVTVFNEDATNFDFAKVRGPAGEGSRLAPFEACAREVSLHLRYVEREDDLAAPLCTQTTSTHVAETKGDGSKIWDAITAAVRAGICPPLDFESREIPDIPALINKIFQPTPSFLKNDFPKTPIDNGSSKCGDWQNKSGWPLQNLSYPPGARGNDRPIKVISNLPYNVGTAIFLNILRHLSGVCSMTLMFQKEVAERLLAKPGSRDYGRLAALSQYFTTGKRTMRLAPGAFYPPPKVFSDVVHFIPNVGADVTLFDDLSAFCSEIFQYKRKKLKNRLKHL